MMEKQTYINNVKAIIEKTLNDLPAEIEAIKAKLSREANNYQSLNIDELTKLKVALWSAKMINDEFSVIKHKLIDLKSPDDAYEYIQTRKQRIINSLCSIQITPNDICSIATLNWRKTMLALATYAESDPNLFELNTFVYY